MRLLRFYQEIPSKKNKIPSINGFVDANPVICHKEMVNGEIVPCFDIPDGLYKSILEKSRDSFQLILPAYSEDILPQQDSTTSRFIAKIALEALALRLSDLEDSLDQLVNDPQFDLIRNHVRRGSPKLWPCHIRRIYPSFKTWKNHEGEVYQIAHEYDFLFSGITKCLDDEYVQGEIYFIVALWGIEFAINLGGPDIEGYQNWLSEHGNISPLYYGKNSPQCSDAEG